MRQRRGAWGASLRIRVWTAVLLPLWMLGCLADTRESESDGPIEGAAETLNGTVPPVGQYEAVGQILRGGGFACTGTLVGPATVLSAAHCFCSGNNRPPNCDTRTTFRLTNVLPATNTGIRTNVSIDGTVTVHPGFVPGSWVDDYAVVELDQLASDLVNNVEPLPVAPSDPRPQVGDVLRLIGYGPSGDTCQLPPDHNKRLADVGVDSVGVTANNDRGFLTFSEATRVICPGDSGGPALNAAGQVVGVASFGDSTFTYRPTFFRHDWIAARLREQTPTAVYCLSPGWARDQGTIRVRLLDENDDGFFVGLDAAAVGRAALRAVDAWNENGLANIRLVFEGVTTNPGTQGDEVVMIRETSSCTGSPCGGAIACAQGYAPNWPQNRIRTDGDIWFVHNPSECPEHNWGFYPDSTTGVDDFQGVLVHELGHVLGLDHPARCGGTLARGVMASGGSQFSDQRYPAWNDIQGLIAHYGPLEGNLNFVESVDGVTWSSGAPTINNATCGPISSASSATSTETTVWVAHLQNVASDGLFRPRVHFRSGNNGGYTQPTTVGSVPIASYDAPAAARAPGTGFVAYTQYELPENNNKYIGYVISDDSGATWTQNWAFLNNYAPVRTRRDGLAAAYDPSTDRFIISYLGDENSASGTNCHTGQAVCDEVRIFSVKRDGTAPRHTSLGLQSIDAAGIACRDAGGANCVIAWVSTGSDACLRYGHGSLDALGTFVLTNDITQCYYGYQTPQITVDPNDPTYPFKLALRQGGNQILTFRKTADTQAYWAHVSTVAPSPALMSPALGSFVHSSAQASELNLFYVGRD